METKLIRIAEIAKTRPKERFTSLAHLINRESLTESHHSLKANKAGGVDKVTKLEYEANLDENVDSLVARMKRQAYKPQPALRVYIPKPGGARRPLGIPAYEDKLVQVTVARILNAIYEQDFLECSFGFRPNRSCHDALQLLEKILSKPHTHYVVDTDIRGFFCNLDHSWMMRFIEHRIEDRNLRRIIARFLKAGIIEAGIRYDTPQGTPQGGACSPILANIYLHYVLDLWFERVIRRHCRGSAHMVRYADDTIFCFQYRDDVLRFYSVLNVRYKKFNLDISKEKTRIIRLDKVDQSSSFDFLGFTHYLGKDRNGRIRIKRKTSKKRYKASLSRCKEWMKRNRNIPTAEFMRILKIKIQGHCNYYCITDNRAAVGNFIDECKRLLYKWLNRRSQRKCFNWNKFNLFLRKYPLPRVKTCVCIFDFGAGSSYIL